MVVGLGIIGLAGFYYVAKAAAPDEAFHALIGLGFGIVYLVVAPLINKLMHGVK